MSSLDWWILGGTIALLVLYGLYKSRGTQSFDDYTLAGKSLPWYHVGLSVMATQASAITFLSAPGQGFADGMRFVQFYFGLPLAMVVLSITFVPIFHKLRVYTAYEFLENRFDGRVRSLTAGLFLLQRGLSTGVSIYAPSIILSTILGWNIYWTNLLMGGLVLLYAVWGGTKAISYTHLTQMLIVTVAMFIAGFLTVHKLPANMGFTDALRVAGKAGRLNLIDTTFDVKSRYNLWSGLIGGFFLQLSYFGTDQSQVGRYLTGETIKQSRMGLLMNGLLKVPMQFLILLVGVLVFVFYQFHESPVFFNQQEVVRLQAGPLAGDFRQLNQQHLTLSAQRREAVLALQRATTQHDDAATTLAGRRLEKADAALAKTHTAVADLVKRNNPAADKNDLNYVFLRFILDYLPHGLIGLLIAMIFISSMGSIAAAYSSLASTTVVDMYRRVWPNSTYDEVVVSRWSTIGWGVFCVVVAQFTNRIGSSLIETVNILGSLFYGVILGIFCVAFYVKSIGGRATFWAAVIAEAVVFICYYLDLMAFLWFNVVGCLLVVVLAWLFTRLWSQESSVRVSS
ncbi:sodium:solute symporter [Fibrella aquatilis]|uniref:Sodium:solute symporter n=1 Tax=Fibrella aquatilis TaxID=2817059 RepID=A0A939JV52_9BACT|nr:sodium:solute symporter [Fibrella aquatilis]MBO0930487.1 sodium:solute symporter [Fibrella aquatilis]